VGERAVNPKGSAPRNEGLDGRRTTAHPPAGAATSRPAGVDDGSGASGQVGGVNPEGVNIAV
jgi:hypothetical protein